MAASAAAAKPPAVHKPVFLPVKTSLGTTPIDLHDDESHTIVYRYQLAGQDSSTTATDKVVDVTKAIARENVLDFFYPHALQAGGGEMAQESLDRLNMRRDVFLLALSAVQALPASDKWSFYQIAGIHGLPHDPFDGVESGDYDPRDPERWGGYCQHGSSLPLLAPPLRDAPGAVHYPPGKAPRLHCHL
ncbi:hypothetical protein GOP47_0011127 [Adiantum capillus-veneris]|uniref:Uncharacterized protein n=1 Tax=Adiantum capillus-veneris TaxID=13818 RepID=A0A9D4US64_ADICA|nr:hypothetical protein GOP47_0011127 [Adiantum capillus-veneris]